MQKIQEMNYRSGRTFCLFASLGISLCLSTVTLAQTEWTKSSENPVLNLGAAGTWDDVYVLTASYYFDGSTYHMWYSGSGTTDELIFDIGHATSTDGLAWTKDALNPVLERGPTDSWDDYRVYFPTVFLVDTIFHMLYSGLDGTNLRIGRATSPDGITWTKDALNPILDLGPAGSWDAVGLVSEIVLFDGFIYHLWYTGIDDQVHRIGHATSPDGIVWTKDSTNNPVMSVGSATSWDYPRVQGIHIIFDGAIYQMWYSGGDFFDWRIGYATSVNGISWTKFENNPILEVGPAGSWDDASTAFGLVQLDETNSTYNMWYSGYDGTNVRIGYAKSLQGLEDFTVAPNTYVIPGSDSVVVTALFTGDTTSRALFAEFEAFDRTNLDSVRLYDDGAHHDGAAADSLFGNVWLVPADERLYYTGLKATLNATAIINYDDLARFTTIGPVVLDSLAITYPADGRPVPPVVKFDLYISNLGAAATATAIGAIVTTTDTCTTIALGNKAYGDIAPGETVVNSGDYRFLINDNCSGNFDIPFALSITSEGYVFWSDSFSVHINPGVGIAENESALPAEFTLHPAYPNPFNPVTTLRYDLPQRADVTLTIYDILGREVRTLVQGEQAAGYKSVTWDGQDASGHALPSGIYIARLVTPENAKSIKMLLLK